jgi:competence protein ComEC
MRRAPVVHAAIAFAAGIAVGLTDLGTLVPAGALFLGAVLLGGLALASLLTSGFPRTPAPAHLPLALLASAGLLSGGYARLDFERSCLHLLPDDTAVTVEGVVTSAVGPRIRLRLDAIRADGSAVPCRLEIPARMRAARGEAAVDPGMLTVGSLVHARASWWRPPGARRTAMRRPGVLMLEEVTRVSAGVSSRPAAERLRAVARDRTEMLFGAQAPLAASVLLAQREGLDHEVRERFARAGLSHLLAISGLHVGLVCGILVLLGSLLRLGRRGSALLAAAGTVGYVLLLGAPHSAVRAALQLVLLLAGTMLQRPTRPEALIATAALVILALEPAALLGAGFQLSFAGVAGLLALRPPLLRLLQGPRASGVLGRGRRWLADAVATSMAATLATAPVVAWHFGQVSPIGVVANLVGIPLLSLTLPALAMALAVGWAAPGVGTFLAGPGILGLAALDRTAALAAAVPGASVAVHGSTAVVLAAAVGVGHSVSRRLGQVRPLIRGVAWVGLTATLLVATTVRPPSGVVEIHVIDVGQGDAVAVRTPARRWLLVDAGLAGRGHDAGERLVVPYLLRNGARRLEGLVLTHPHLDHMGGAAAVVTALRPRWVGDPGSPAASAPYLDLLNVVHGSGSPWMGLREGHRLMLDGLTVDFLHPAVIGAVEADPNDLSVVMKISYGDFSALLTGDATAAVEARLLRQHASGLRVDVLKLGHHGSATSSTAEFLAATDAPVAVVSAGAGNRYGHPHRAVMERLEAREMDVLRTDQHGAVVIRADGRGGVDVRTERGRLP